MPTVKSVPVVCGVVEALNAQAVQIVATGLQIPVVLFPGGHRIAVHPGGGENGLPQLLHGLAPGEVGENLLGPGGAGDGRDAPLLFILPLIHIGLQDLIGSLAALGHLLQVHALEAIGILRHQMNPAGENVHVVLLPGLLPGLHRA